MTNNVGKREEFVGVGANWGRAPDVDRNQVQLETYYRTYITRGQAHPGGQQ